jgi:uncharacterized membrane protein
MEMMGVMTEMFRWVHVIAAFLWVGLSFFSAFVLQRFFATADAVLQKKLMTELLAPSFYLMRWGAVWTWVMGFLLIGRLFYSGGMLFEGDTGWNAASIFALVVVYVLGFAIYEGLARSPIAKNSLVFALVSLVLVTGIIYLMVDVAGFSYRGYVIHVGATFGTIMVANVWMTLWPTHRRFLQAVKNGAQPDMAAFGKSRERGKHNIYLTVPVLYTMLNMHTAMTATVYSPLYLVGAIAVGWLAIALLFRIASRVN